MAFDNAYTAVTGGTLSAAQWNTHVRDNFTALWVGTTAGDVDYYATSTTKLRIAAPANIGIFTYDTTPQWLNAAAGDALKYLRVNNAGSGFEWATNQLYFCEVSKTGLSIGASGTVSFDTEVSDDRDWHDNSTNPERITPDIAGWYTPGCYGLFGDISGTGHYIYTLEHQFNGSSTKSATRYETLQTANAKIMCWTGRPIEFNGTTDYLTLDYAQNTGDTLTLTTFMWLTLIQAT